MTPIPYSRLRKVLSFNTATGLTFPSEFMNALGLKKGDYAEVYLKDRKTIIVKKHEIPMQPIKETD